MPRTGTPERFSLGEPDFIFSYQTKLVLVFDHETKESHAQIRRIMQTEADSPVEIVNSVWQEGGVGVGRFERAQLLQELADLLRNGLNATDRSTTMSGPPLPPRSSQSPHSSYNPQAYAQQPSSPRAPYQPYSPYPAPNSQPPSHQPYNPAAYQDNTIAGFANNIYGPASQNVSSYGPRGSSQSSSPNLPQGYPPTSPTQQYAPRISTGSSYNRSASHRYSTSAPHPYRQPSSAQYSPGPSPATYYDAYQHQPISPATRFPAPPQHSPSPDFYDHRTPPTVAGRNGSGAHFNSAFAPPTPPMPMPNPEPYVHAVERQGSNRHPQSRPLPGPPAQPSPYAAQLDPDEGYEETVDDAERRTDDLFDEVERSLLNTGTFTNHQAASASYLDQTTNGHYEPTSATSVRTYYDDYDDDDDADSDAEAAAGLEAMRIAEQQEEEDRQRRSRSSSYMTNGFNEYEQQAQAGEAFEDEYDYAGYDMSALAGGFAVPMSHRNAAGLSATSPVSQRNLGQHPSGSSHRTARTESSGATMRTSSQTSITNMASPGSFSRRSGTAARVDESGTGGLSDPTVTGRKMSFENDDPAERAIIMQQAQQAHQQGGIPGDAMVPETFYQYPSHSGPRPLPSIPASTEYPVADPAAYVQHASIHGTGFPRSQSLVSTSTTQQAIAPARAKTDAEEKRKSVLRIQATGTESSPVTPMGGPDLPTIPAGRRVQPSKLRDADYDRCVEPWALSSLTRWLRSIAEGDPELKSHMIEEILVNLFTSKVSNINIPVAESLSQHVLQVMYASNTLIQDEEWLRFGYGEPTGVLYQLTGRGCYSQTLHNYENSGRCYSYHCQRTVRKIDVNDGSSPGPVDWATYYSITKEDIADVDKKEVERQNNLHEVVQSEYKFINDLKLLRTLYQDGLEHSQPSIVPPKNLDLFIKTVFGKLAAVRKVNEEYLLPQLLYRQKEQGPWVVGFSDIFRDWIRKAKPAYIEYTANFPNAEFMIRQEDRRNTMFHNFLDSARNDSRAQRLAWDHYLKAPITKIQRYSLLLQVVLKNMKQDSEEKQNLQLAIEEIQEATRECNARLADETRKVELLDLQSRLKLRQEMSKVELNLTQWGRELIHSGQLQREGNTRFTWLDIQAILLDNFLILAKKLPVRDGKPELYDVSKMPIPMELLVLESADEDPVVRSSMKGVSTVNTTNTTNARSNSITPRPVVQSSNSGSSLQQVTSASSNQLTTTTSIDQSQSEKTLYPFKIKHLGKEVFTLYTPSASNRREWCDKIIEAKTKHAASLFSQDAEPFKLNVIADAAFAYDSSTTSQKMITIKGTPLVRALEDVESRYKSAGRPAPICRARVNCATSFTQQNGLEMIAIGTEYGVYLSEAGNPRGWTRVIPIPRVTQIAVLEDFSLLLLISDKSLIAYHLDVVTTATASSTASTTDSIKKSPQKLSGSKDVGFFTVGRMKDRTLLFYEKRESRTTIFKILEPVYQKSSAPSTRAGRLFRGHTDFFRDYDDFYIPADCTALDLFSNSLAVATSKGFEVLGLDKKTAWSVPDLTQQHVQTMATRLRDMLPVAMFRLAADGSELLCVYEECAVYVNKFGDVNRAVIMEFVGRARQASLVGGYLVLFDSDFVEVRDAISGRLKQVVAGRDVRCLDNGRGQAGVTNAGMQRSVKFALQHPENEKSQIVVELALNESRRN
ncbi:MAG: hypothetical protein Q9159_002745 [Coniocarpon cinnabarinum]